jgi:hypothetical protein
VAIALAAGAALAWSIGRDDAASALAEASRPDPVPRTEVPLVAAAPSGPPILVGRRHAPAAAPPEAAALASTGFPPPVSLPLRVVVVDAESDEAVVAPVSFRSDDPVTEDAESGWRVQAALDSRLALWPSCSAPEGFVNCEEHGIGTRVFRWARSLRMVYPLRREALVSAQVREPRNCDSRERMKFGYAFHAEAFSDGEGPHPSYLVLYEPSDEPDPSGYARVEYQGGGCYRIHGVPFFRDQPIWLLAYRPWDLRTQDADSPLTAEPEVESSEDAVVRATLAHDTRSTLRVSIRLAEFPFDLPAGIGGCFNCRCGGHRAPASQPTGSLEIDVRRRDGRVLAGATIDVEGVDRVRTDENGHATVERVPIGKRTASLKEPGLVPAAVSVEVLPDVTSHLRLDEPEGGTIHLTVVAEDGDPVPYAKVDVGQASHTAWLDVTDDDVQRIDSWTDHGGVRILEHVEPGVVRVKAKWCALEGEAEAHVVEGGATDVRIVLRRSANR